VGLAGEGGNQAEGAGEDHQIEQYRVPQRKHSIHHLQEYNKDIIIISQSKEYHTDQHRLNFLVVIPGEANGSWGAANPCGAGAGAGEGSPLRRSNRSAPGVFFAGSLRFTSTCFTSGSTEEMGWL